MTCVLACYCSRVLLNVFGMRTIYIDRFFSNRKNISTLISVYTPNLVLRLCSLIKKLLFWCCTNQTA